MRDGVIDDTEQDALDRIKGKIDKLRDAVTSLRAEVEENKRIWESHGGEWTEAGFWGFLRSQLRQSSRRWPPLARHALNAAKRPSQSGNKRLKWEYQCCECGEWFKRTDVQVDHIVACGSLKNWEDFAVFAERLFSEAAGLQVMCKECHGEKTKRR